MYKNLDGQVIIIKALIDENYEKMKKSYDKTKKIDSKFTDIKSEMNEIKKLLEQVLVHNKNTLPDNTD